MGQTELRSGTIAGGSKDSIGIDIGIGVWEGEGLNELYIAETTVDEIGTGEHEEMSLCKVDLDQVRQPCSSIIQEQILTNKQF